MTEMVRAEAFALGDVVPDFPDLSDLRDRPLFTYSHPGQGAFRRRLIRLVELLSGSARMERLYRDWQQAPHDRQAPVFAEALRILRIRTEFVAGGPDCIPARGGVLVVANHPFGIADGLALGDLVARVRPDVKLMVHSLLCQPAEARGALLPVDFSGGAGARRTSAATRRAAVDWLEAGHVLVIFPAGGVATAPRPLARRAADPAWHPFAARLATRPGVQVVPVYVHGQNSRLFQIVSHFSYPLRVALLFRETLRRQGGAVRLSVGPAQRVDEADKTGVTARLRALTLRLAGPRGPRPETEFTYPARLRW